MKIVKLIVSKIQFKQILQEAETYFNIWPQFKLCITKIMNLSPYIPLSRELSYSPIIMYGLSDFLN